MEREGRDTIRLGRRGTLVLPAAMRRRLGITEGDVLIAEEYDGGVLIRPAVTLPVERYDSRRKAELLLCNAVDPEDYARARRDALALGVDPDSIPHEPPDRG
jgi:AbrB family looped-hinge helix DNA binding protein